MKTYRVGFVGMGFIGKVHAYGHLNLPLFFDSLPFRTVITHVCTRHPESATRAAQQIGAAQAVTDFRAVTENPDIDIVHICTPNDRHLEALLSAMACGKHIYCDKPLVKNAHEADQVAAALPNYRGIAQMTLQNRFFPATLKARQLIEKGALGRILEFRADYLHSGSVDPRTPLKWKLRADAGGGAIADLGSHVLDLIGHLIGPYDSVSAATGIAYPERPLADCPERMGKVDAEDHVFVLARMACGAVGTISAGKIATGTEDELRFEIHGTRGALRYNAMAPHYLQFFDAAAPNTPLGGRSGWTAIATGQRFDPPAGTFPSSKNAIGWIRGHMQCLYHFLDCVHRGVPAEPGLEHGIRLQHLLETIRRSALSGTWMKVAP